MKFNSDNRNKIAQYDSVYGSLLYQDLSHPEGVVWAVDESRPILFTDLRGHVIISG
jgi:hypothetical protein